MQSLNICLVEQAALFVANNTTIFRTHIQKARTAASSAAAAARPNHPSTEDLAGPADVQPLVPEKRPTSSAQQPAVLNTICVQTRGLRCFGFYEASASRHFFYISSSHRQSSAIYSTPSATVFKVKKSDFTANSEIIPET